MASYSSAKESLLVKVKESIKTSSLAPIEEEFSSIPGSEGEKKTILDQAFREALKEVLLKNEANHTDYVALSAQCVKEGMCSAALPFILLSDLFDCVTLDLCDRIFVYVEENVALWTSPQLYSSGKNFLLRMCNDLLRRLSRSQDTVFCGRIQMFLAQIFPLSEKSGLNLMSQFNLENVTTCSDQPDLEKASHFGFLSEEGMEIEEGEAVTPTHAPIDFELYQMFWKLQDFFREPSVCYNRDQWKTLKTNTERVLEVFDSVKLDHASAEAKEEEEEDSEHVYFAKYLTSEKLFDLQLHDSQFRRQILIQFLILFQYLTTQIKFKQASQVLTDQQNQWVVNSTEKVYSLLRETPPHGEKFAKMIKHILNREEIWIAWKNDSCPSFVKPRSETSPPSKSSSSYISLRSKKRFYPYPGSPSKMIDMGSRELTRLWNLCPENMEACSAPERVFLPSLTSFFKEAVEQNDPEAMIDDEFKLVNDSNFIWKALRLLSRLSHQYFNPSPTTPKDASTGKAMAVYLEDVLAKLVKESVTKSDQSKQDEEQTSS